MTSLLDIPGEPSSTRVVVAMSGGVDSSVVAALLARSGYDVVGVTLQLYNAGASAARKGACCAGADIADARRVAEQIGIPHYVLDYEERFRAAVIDTFADSYAAGETPIPCVECNKSVKFTDLLGTARDLGAACLATGHYVVSRDGPTGRTLHRAADPGRDQSYFLYGTTREQLADLRFPLGGLPKAETRRLAEKLGLAVAAKPDSQDICFVPSGHYGDVVRRQRPDAVREGEIVHVDGRTLGRHGGVVDFTIGQRRGIGIASPEPLYVVAIDAARARVLVGPRTALSVARIGLRDLNWLGDDALDALPPDGLDVHVKVRSTRPPQPARLTVGPDGAAVSFPTTREGVAPGQACVIYDSDRPDARVLGGGVIATRSVEAFDPLPAAA